MKKTQGTRQRRGNRRRERDERLTQAAVEALQAGREGLDEKGESLWAVYRRRFKKHTLGKIGAVVLVLLYGVSLFAGFLSPADMIWADKTKSYHPPTGIRWLYGDLGKTSIRPYVYERKLLNVALKEYGLIPLYSLRVVFPSSMTSVQVYIMIVGILAMVSWTSLARVIRGMVLSLENEDYVLSAMTMGLSHLKIITRHILPNTLSFVIVQATITIPSYILGESALSLLGLGITEPQSSWGLMPAVARNYRVVKDFPWVLVPGFAIFIAIMAWNFFGDGVRDAVDPRSKH